MSEIIELKIKAVIGFNGNFILNKIKIICITFYFLFIFNVFLGKALNSISYSNCGKYLIYPLGSFVVIKNLSNNFESFLDMHSHEVTCLKLSNDGAKLASGQINISGVKVSKIFFSNIILIYNLSYLLFFIFLNIFFKYCIIVSHKFPG